MKRVKIAVVALASIVGIASAIAAKKALVNTRYVFDPNQNAYVRVTYNQANCQPTGSFCSYEITGTQTLPNTIPAGDIDEYTQGSNPGLVGSGANQHYELP